MKYLTRCLLLALCLAAVLGMLTLPAHAWFSDVFRTASYTFVFA